MTPMIFLRGLCRSDARRRTTIDSELSNTWHIALVVRLSSMATVTWPQPSAAQWRKGTGHALGPNLPERLVERPD